MSHSKKVESKDSHDRKRITKVVVNPYPGTKWKRNWTSYSSWIMGECDSLAWGLRAVNTYPLMVNGARVPLPKWAKDGCSKKEIRAMESVMIDPELLEQLVDPDSGVESDSTSGESTDSDTDSGEESSGPDSGEEENKKGKKGKVKFEETSTKTPLRTPNKKGRTPLLHLILVQRKRVIR